MRAIITGGSGFIGSHLADALLARGWDVCIVDDQSSGRNAVPGATLIRDRVQDARLPVAVDYDAVFHLAGKVGPTGVLGWAGAIAKDTIDAAWAAGFWAAFFGCPLIDVSTSEVYGSGHADREDDDCTFRAPVSARKEYAVAKLAAETMLRNTPGLDVRIVRPFNVTGPRQLPDGGFVLPRFIHQALAGEPLTVYQPGSQRRAFTHVADIVDGILAVLDRGRAGETYNLGNPANAGTIVELAEAVIAQTGGSWRLVDPRELHGPAFAEAPDKIPDAMKAARELGWAPRWTREEIVADVLDYWRREAAA